MIEVTKILDQFFSEEGLKSTYFSFKCPPSGLNFSLQKEDEYYTISFEKDKPEVIFNKFLKVSLSLNSIILGPEKGYISVGVLPKIPFKYEWIFYHKSEVEEFNL